MKKFIASENIAIASSREFKASIEYACRNTEQGRQYSSDVFGKTFVGTVVTFDTTTKKVHCYDLRDYVNSENKENVKKSIASYVDKISSVDGNENDEFITFVEASKFEYHGYIGYPSPQQQELDNLKLDNIFMSLYIDILTDNPSELYTDDSDRIEELELSVRTYNCLKRSGIDTIAQIKKLTLEEVFQIRNLGMRSVQELEQILNMKFISLTL